MMQLLAKITKLSIEKKYITYEELYTYNEKHLFSMKKKKKDSKLQGLINEFENKKIQDIPELEMPKVKVRDLNPLVNGKRIK